MFEKHDKIAFSYGRINPSINPSIVHSQRRATMSLRIHFDILPVSKAVVVSFDQRLQHLGRDYKLFANNDYEPKPEESQLLRDVLCNLFTDRSGVEDVNITPFSLLIHHCAA